MTTNAQFSMYLRFAAFGMGAALTMLLGASAAFAVDRDGDGIDDGPNPVGSVTLDASPSVIYESESTLLSWSGAYVSDCSINQGIGEVALPGEISIAPLGDSTFTITCSDMDGMLVIASKSVTVDVPPMPTASLSASPSAVSSGNSATLAYACTNSISRSISPSVGTLTSGTGTYTVSTGALTSSRTYTLNCSNTVGTAHAYATVNVLSASITASPRTIARGQSTQLIWNSSYVDFCTTTGFETFGDTNGASTISPTTTTTYTITCTKNVSTATGGTWQLYNPFSPEQEYDITDLACPIQNSNRAYSVFPTCPPNPAGKECGDTWMCKRNVVYEEASGNCSIRTWLYKCVGGGTSTTAQTVTASVTVTVTDGPVDPDDEYCPVGSTSSWAQYNNERWTPSDGSTYGTAEFTGQSHASVSAAATACKSSCESGKYCNLEQSTQSGSSTYTCYALNGNATNKVSVSPATTNGVTTAWYALEQSCSEDPNGGGAAVTCSPASQRVATGASAQLTATLKGGATTPITWYNALDVQIGTGATLIWNPGSDAAHGAYATAKNGSGTVTSATCIVDQGGACSNPSVTITADRTRVRPGGSVSLAVSGEGINDSCTVVNANTGAELTTLTAASCDLTPTTLPSGALQTQTTFTVTCDDGDASASVIVNVVPGWIEF